MWKKSINLQKNKNSFAVKSELMICPICQFNYGVHFNYNTSYVYGEISAPYIDAFGRKRDLIWTPQNAGGEAKKAEATYLLGAVF